MYVKKAWEGEHLVYCGNDCYEPVREDVTYGLVVQHIIALNPTEPHSHPDVEQVYYIRSGQGVVLVDGEEQEVGPDSVVFIPAGAVHAIRPLPGEQNLIYISIAHHHEISSKDRSSL